MNIETLSRALGNGVAKAAEINYDDAVRMLRRQEVLSETLVVNAENDFATYEVLPVQELENGNGRCVEFRVLASNGEQQLIAYYYAYSTPQ